MQDGYTPGLPFMSHLWDRLPASYRPLAFYAVTEGVALWTRAVAWVSRLHTDERMHGGGRRMRTQDLVPRRALDPWGGEAEARAVAPQPAD